MDPDPHQLEKWDPDPHQNVLDPQNCFLHQKMVQNYLENKMFYIIFSSKNLLKWQIFKTLLDISKTVRDEKNSKSFEFRRVVAMHIAQ